MHLNDDQVTLVIPLYAKAVDCRAGHPILNDQKAGELLRQLDLDFEWRETPALRLLVVRARELDAWAREFLDKNPNPIVLNLGCGLDTRVSRMGPPASVRWFDVDSSEVIGLRRNFYSDHDGYRMLASPLADPKWLDSIPSDGPALAIADGALAYLPREEVEGLIKRLTGKFAHGQIMFDVVNTRAAKTGNARLTRGSTPPIKWSVDDLREVDALDARLRRTATMPLLGSEFLPRRYRMLNGLASLDPNIQNSMRLVRYEF